MTRLSPSGLLLLPLLLISSACVPRNAVAVTPTVELTVHGVESRPLTTAEPESDDDGRSAGDLVEVEWKGTWWPATLLERRGYRWFVHYDGYADEWNELVTMDRVRDRPPVEPGPVLVPMEDDVDP